MKFALCAIAGNENLYIREWVEHHLNIGFDKIIIYANDPKEDPNLILFDYVMQNKVEIIPWYKTNTPDGSFQGMVQCPAYNDCLHRYGIEFDWIAFFDIDEFLTMEYENINQWFDVCQYKNTDGKISPRP